MESADKSDQVLISHQLIAMISRQLSPYYLFGLFVIVSIIPLIKSENRDDYDYQGLNKQKFRAQQLNVVWDEAVKHLKGQKLKSLMTELKAHEKAVLNLKKKRQLPDEEEEGGSLKSLKSNNLKWIDETVDLELNLENILNRHHLDSSLAHAHKKVKLESKADSENHINSVLENSEDIHRKKFDEPRVELLYSKGLSVASHVLRQFDSESKEGRRRRKEFEEWFLVLEQDLVMLDSRLKKQRWLEDEVNRLKPSRIEKSNVRNAENNHESSSLNPSNHLDSVDLQKRLKSLVHKINKSEKELNERISSRKYHEFPTSRSEGEL